MNNHIKGQKGENTACLFLLKNKFRILQRNYRITDAEIDIIALSPKNELCFVEVKASYDLKFGRPEVRVDHRKMRKIYKAASIWL